jgi:hypothetical protein
MRSKVKRFDGILTARRQGEIKKERKIQNKKHTDNAVCAIGHQRLKVTLLLTAQARCRGVSVMSIDGGS